MPIKYLLTFLSFYCQNFIKLSLYKSQFLMDVIYLIMNFAVEHQTFHTPTLKNAQKQKQFLLISSTNLSFHITEFPQYTFQKFLIPLATICKLIGTNKNCCWAFKRIFATVPFHNFTAIILIFMMQPSIYDFFKWWHSNLSYDYTSVVNKTRLWICFIYVSSYCSWFYAC